jgi:hypothetical protein
MKTIKTLFLFVGMLVSGATMAQNHFIGIYRIQNNGCGDYVMEQKEVPDGATFDQASLEFKANHKNENPRTYYIKSTENALVIEFTTHLYPGACIYKEIRVLKGSTLEKIRADYNELYTKYKGVYVTAPKETVVFNAVLKDDANGQIISKEYTNIAVKIISHKSNGKSAFTAQLSNKLKDKAMVVKFKMHKEGIPTLVDGKGNNSDEVTIVIPPNATITQKLGNAEYYEMHISEPQTYNIKAKNVDNIENIKNWVKEQITTKDKRIESLSGGIGIRG